MIEYPLARAEVIIVIYLRTLLVSSVILLQVVIKWVLQKKDVFSYEKYRQKSSFAKHFGNLFVKMCIWSSCNGLNNKQELIYQFTGQFCKFKQRNLFKCSKITSLSVHQALYDYISVFLYHISEFLYNVLLK